MKNIEMRRIGKAQDGEEEKKQKMGENKNVYLFDTFVYAIFMYIYVIFAGAYFSII